MPLLTGRRLHSRHIHRVQRCGDINDPAPARHAACWAPQRRHQLRSRGIDIDHAGKRIGVEFPELWRVSIWIRRHCLRTQRRIVEQYVETSEVFYSVENCGGRAVWIAYVGAERDNGISATDVLNFARDLLKFLAVEVN